MWNGFWSTMFLLQGFPSIQSTSVQLQIKFMRLSSRAQQQEIITKITWFPILPHNFSSLSDKIVAMTTDYSIAKILERDGSIFRGHTLIYTIGKKKLHVGFWKLFKNSANLQLYLSSRFLIGITIGIFRCKFSIGRRCIISWCKNKE